MSRTLLLVFLVVPLRVPGRPTLQSGLPAVASPAAVVDRGLSLVENLGQWPSGVAFRGQIGGAVLGVGKGEILLLLPTGSEKPDLHRLRFEGASSGAAVAGEGELPGRFHYYLGNEPSRWVEGARSFAGVRVESLYPDVDLVLRSDGGRLKYDLHLRRASDLGRVVMACEGSKGLRIEADGSLVIDTACGPIRQLVGTSWQTLRTGERRPAQVRFDIRADGRVGFVAADVDPDLPLVIDPELLWSTYLGSSAAAQGDSAEGVALAANGDVIVVGYVKWQDFPTTPWSYQHPYTGNLGHDVFVTRFRGADGALVYSSLIGSSGEDRASCVAVDRHGRAVIGGQTALSDFPTTPGAWDTSANSNGTGFVLRLSAQGALDTSTFFEGTGQWDSFQLRSLRVDPRSDAIVLAGVCSGAGLPATPGAFDTSWDGYYTDVFVARLAPSGSSLEWGTYLGGFGIEEFPNIALDPEGRVGVTGVTMSFDYPVTPGAFQTVLPGVPSQGPSAAFVTVLSPRGSHLVWSSYLGGSTPQDTGGGLAIAFETHGGVLVAGRHGTVSPAFTPTFPTTPGVVQPDYGGQGDGFVTRFTADGSSLVYSTYLGGPNWQGPEAIAVDPSGMTTLVGPAYGGIPVTRGAFDTTWHGATDAFIVRLNPTATKVLYGTYVGGPSDDLAFDIALDPTDRTTIVGYTSGSYPTTPGAFQSNPPGSDGHGFATTLHLLHRGVRLYGDSTPSCLGPLRLNTYSAPLAGATGFGFYLSGAPPSSDGWLLIGSEGTGADFEQGAQIWLDPAQGIQRLAIQTGPDGYVEVPYELQAAASGITFSVQALIRNTAACGGSGSACASNALTVTVP